MVEEVSPYDAGSEKSVRKRKKKVAVQEYRQRRAVAAMLQSSDFRDFVWRILEKCGLYSDPFVFGEPHGTSRNAGKIAVGLEVLKEILAADPQAYVKMQQEHGEQ